MQDRPKRKRKPGNRMLPLDVTASQRWSLAERVQYAVVMVGGLQAAQEKLGIPMRTLANWQSGAATPTDLDRLRLLSEAAGRPPDWIERGGPLIEAPAQPPDQPSPALITVQLPASILLPVFAIMCSKMPLATVEALQRTAADAVARRRNEQGS
jgi:hypothetical protein